MVHEYLKLLFDRGLILGGALLVSFLTTKWVEKVKRTEAMTLELGKLRAAAYTRLLAHVIAIEMHERVWVDLYKALAGSGRTPELDARLAAHQKRGLELVANYADTAMRDLVLMERKVALEIEDYFKYVPRLISSHAEGTFTLDKLELALGVLVSLRYRLLRFFPPMTAVGHVDPTEVAHSELVQQVRKLLEPSPKK